MTCDNDAVDCAVRNVFIRHTPSDTTSLVFLPSAVPNIRREAAGKEERAAADLALGSRAKCGLGKGQFVPIKYVALVPTRG